MLGTSGGGMVAGSLARYKPYGSYRGTTPTQTLTDRDFTGQKENREVGLLYYNARFYVPSIGRFLTADTLVPDLTNPQQFNRYTYVLGNPLRLVDPSGHCALSTYLLESAEACWDEGKMGKFGNWFVIDGKYIFDQNHFKSAYKRATELIEDITNAMKDGGDVSVHRGKGDSGAFIGTWAISKGEMTREEIIGTAYAIYQEFELGYEAYQAAQGWDQLDQRISAFGVEDLPSDYLGFWAAAEGKSEDELFTVLEGLGEVTAMYMPPSLILGMPENYNFNPMAIEFTPQGPTANSSPWPAEFRIQPLNNQGRYAFKSLGFVPK